MNTKHAPADLQKIVDNLPQLDKEQQVKLLTLLQNHENLFDSTLGQWKGSPYKVELWDGVTPYHTRPYAIPQAYEQTFKDKVEPLCNVGVLRKINWSKWAAPTFLIPKIDNTFWFISNFRKLNQRIKIKPYPMPKIQDLLITLEGF